jgi:hypothetical protein
MDNTDLHYNFLMEGRLDAMFLPAGAIAWLWQYERPQGQTDSASQFARIANELGDAVMDSALLRADQNILVLRTNSGNRISVYPDGGLGANGEPVEKSPEGIHAFIMGQAEPELGSVVVMPDDLEMGPENLMM